VLTLRLEDVDQHFARSGFVLDYKDIHGRKGESLISEKRAPVSMLPIAAPGIHLTAAQTLWTSS